MSRYAVIQAQGVQFRVFAGEEHVLPNMDLAPGAPVVFDRVLLIGDEGGVQVGQPLVAGASVTGEVVRPERGKKITVGVFKRRKKYRRKIGYRDTLTRVRILDIIV
jgi:large subunit ribosomal protein L21